MSDSSEDEDSEDEDSEDEESEDEKIPSDKHLKKYFLIHLMYNINAHLWPRTTCIYYSLAFNDNIHEKEQSYNEYKKKKNKKHAEKLMLTYLQGKYDSARLKKLSSDLSDLDLSGKTAKRSHKEKGEVQKRMKMNHEIIINYSPCKQCADDIISYKEIIEKDCDVHISITFGSFYKMYPKDDKNKHIEGLAKLHNAGIKLQLVWDSETLIERIKKLKIGTEEDREIREKKDREYMELVEKRAKAIALNEKKTYKS